MITARRTILVTRGPRPSPVSRRRPSPSGIATPTMNRKKGKIRSVGVQPCQSACRSGAYTAPHVPGLLTSTIPATVSPRNTSRETSRAFGTTPSVSPVEVARAAGSAARIPELEAGDGEVLIEGEHMTAPELLEKDFRPA